MNAVSPRNSLSVEAGLPYLPIFLGLRGRKAVLIGSDTAAASTKRDLLRRAGAVVRAVVGPPAPRDFAGAVLAVDASDDIEINRRSVALARAAGVPINVVDRPELCDFIMPAILERAPVIVAISTGGTAPIVARMIRQRLETALPAGIGAVAALASRLRKAARTPSPRFWERLFDGPVAQLAANGESEAALALAEDMIANDVEESAVFEVATVGSPDPDLLTVKAARLIRTADLIIHAPEIPPSILDLARRDAQKRVASSAAMAARHCAQVQHRGSARTPICVYLQCERAEAERGVRAVAGLRRILA